MLARIRERVGQLFEKPEAIDHYGRRRAECWWEPIYNPKLQGVLKRGSWDFTESAGPSESYFRGSDLHDATTIGEQHEIKSVTFVDCDFQGKFDPETIVMFEDCRFVRCDFAYSYWRDSHFRQCHFEDCSFSLASFSRCQFRENTWRALGFSGSKTDFEKCHVTNVKDLIDAGVSQKEPGNESRRHALYQWYRLQGTKAHLSRTLLSSHEATGDDTTFYETARVHDLQQSYSVIARHVFNLAFSEDYGRVKAIIGLMLGLLENALLRFFGRLNAWGGSVLRPLVGLVGLQLLFSAIYWFCAQISWHAAFQKSFNITILAGYTLEYGSETKGILLFVQNLHAAISIVIYTVFFGTVISRLSRVR